MIARNVLDAIGDIDDFYIMEFSKIRQKKRVVSRRLLAVAACLCLVITAVAVSFMPFSDDPTVPSSAVTIPKGEVIWGTSDGDLSSNVFDHVSAEEIFYTDALCAAFSRSVDDTDVFAIKVIEVTGASKEDIYERFVKPLGLYEEYISRGVIFGTQEQIKQIICPAEFGFVFALGSKTSEHILITKRYLETIDDGPIDVMVYISTRTVPETELLPDFDKIASLYLEVMQDVIDDYGIQPSQIKSLEPYRNVMYVKLNRDMLFELLNDERISRIWLTDSTAEGFDLGG